MKKKVMILLFVMIIGLVACGKDAGVAQNDATKDEMNAGELQELSTVEGVNEIDEAEQQYLDLIAQYDEELYGEPQKLSYIPQARQHFDFAFFDEVVEIEEIGNQKKGMPNTYVIIHFRRSENDTLMCVRRMESTVAWTDDNEKINDVDAFLDFIQEKETSLNQIRGEGGVKLPKVGEKGIFYKCSEIANVRDTGIVYNDAKYYEVDNGNGFKNLVYVPSSKIPEESIPLYKFGVFEDNRYYNSEYEILIDTEQVDYSTYTLRGYDGYALKGAAPYWDESMWISYDDGACSIYFNTYEFSKKLSEEEFQKATQQICDYEKVTLAGDDNIAGKNYRRAEGNIGESEMKLWYRCENNRIYVIRSAAPYDILMSCFKEYSE